MVSSTAGLSIAELIFYFPALFVSGYVAYRHGFSRSAAWVFLVLLSLIRIIGASAELASETNRSTGVTTMAFILSGVGVSPLLLAMIGILRRLYQGMSKQILPPRPRLFLWLSMIPIAGMVLSIVGGVDLQGNSIDSTNTGQSLYHASSVLFLVTFLMATAITGFAAFNLPCVPQADMKLFFAVAVSVPFLLVRVIFLLLVSFNLNNRSSQFGFAHGSIMIKAFMAIFEEFVVVTIYLAAVLLTPQIVG